MRPWKLMNTLLIATTLTFVSRALAEDKTKVTDTKTTITTTTTGVHVWTEPATRWQKSSDLIGKNVHTPAGEKLGDVDDFIIDANSGRIIYGIIGCGIGKQCAVPAAAMQLPPDAAKFIVPRTKDELKAYAFDKGRYPDFSDRAWANQTFQHYNVNPYWAEFESGAGRTAVTGTVTASNVPYYGRFTSQWLKATDIMGKAVKNPQNENLGKIEDLAVDPDGHRVIYGVLSFGGFLGMGDKLFALPFSSLTQLSGDKNHFVLAIEKDRLKNATGFDKKTWPNMADARFATDIHGFYGQKPYWQPGERTDDPNRNPNDPNNPNLRNPNPNDPNNPNNPNRDGSRNP